MKVKERTYLYLHQYTGQFEICDGADCKPEISMIFCMKEGKYHNESGPAIIDPLISSKYTTILRKRYEYWVEGVYIKTVTEDLF
jgi:hypothetical protein